MPKPFPRRRHNMRLYTSLLALAVLVFGSVQPAAASADPPLRFHEISDQAGLYSAEALKDANQKLEQLAKTTGHELVIETFTEAKPGTDFGLRAENRFKDLGANGVYVAIWKKPGHF